MKKNLNKMGFALIEVLIGVSLLSATIITVSSLTISMMHANALNKNNLIATELSREGLEVVRQIRDTNFMYFRDFLNGISLNQELVVERGAEGSFVLTPMSIEDSDSLYLSPTTPYYTNVSTDLKSPFSRTVKVTPLLLNSDANSGLFDSNLPDDHIFKVNVESTVAWMERNKEREIVLTTQLTDWKK